MPDHPFLLEAKGLSRHFGNNIAVNDVSFSIKQGEVLGFLGPNGAGKSTTMKMLSGNLAPDKGQILINGIDLLDKPAEAKACIGYLPETPPLYKEQTVSEFLRFCAKLNNIPKKQRITAVDNAIERCGLSDVSQRLIGHLSKGFQQRVGIAQAIIHEPAVVILDEPTSGLDPIQIREIRQLIREIANQHSVILSTHILPEVDMLCDRVQIISEGQLLFIDTIETLHEYMQSSALLLRFDTEISVQQLNAIDHILQSERLADNTYRVTFAPQHDPTQAILSKSLVEQWQLTMLMPEKHSMEDVFMKILREER
ncbi:MAG TPA: ABC transporter ATP-binding protein [Methylophaga aminisulfidivorans]|uniref:ABC transporter ATP-binding protein n=1 Tax=Methylophaga aminisulfidivorans TaxID=230105 RepID=A0A7C1VQ12_9GAMM|nr:ABC transporter ATP-binding protein [Methylophaga aminisulfidivorans]